MKLARIAAIGAAAAALLAAGSANAVTFIANSSNSGGLLSGSTVLTVNTVSNAEFTFDIKNATDTWGGATGLGAFAFNSNIVGTAGTIKASGAGSADAQTGGLNAAGCDGTGAFFCFAFSPAVAVTSNMLFDIKAGSGAFNLSSTNVPDLKIQFVDSSGNKVGTLFSADVPFCSRNCGGSVPEPASWSMMIIGLGAVGAAMRMRRKTALAAV